MKMSFLWGGSVDDIWRKDLERCQRRVQQLQIRASSVTDPQIRGTSYREVRLLLKEFVFLDAQLQKDIVAQKYSGKELLKRTEELKKINAEVKEIDRLIV